MIEIQRLPKMKEYYAGKYELKTGEFYECVQSPEDVYLGWILYVVNLSRESGKVYGSWVNEGPAVFSEMTGQNDKFRFKRLNMKLVEVKE